MTVRSECPIPDPAPGGRRYGVPPTRASTATARTAGTAVRTTSTRVSVTVGQLKASRTANPKLHRTANPKVHRTANPKVRRTANPKVHRTANPKVHRTANPHPRRSALPLVGHPGPGRHPAGRCTADRGRTQTRATSRHGVVVTDMTTSTTEPVDRGPGLLCPM